MASGYAKATGKLPAVVLHTTVGALHATMALRTAMHERVPMVVMAGESVDLRRAALLQDRPAMAAPPDRPRRAGAPRRAEREMELRPQFQPASCAQTIQRACQLAMGAPRGPVFVSVPIEYLMETMAHALPAGPALPSLAGGGAAALDALAEATRRSETPADHHRGSRTRPGDGGRAGRAGRDARRAGGRSVAAVLRQLSARPPALCGRRRGRHEVAGR